MKNRFESTLPIRVFHLGIMATALSISVVIWQLSLHVFIAGDGNNMSMFGHFLHALGDTALLFPLALLGIGIGLLFSVRLGLKFGSWRGILGSASVISILFFLGAVPGVRVHGYSHGYADQVIEGFSESPAVSPDEGMEVDMLMTKSNLSEATFHGLHDAAVSQVVVLPLTILGLLLLSKSGNLMNCARRPEPRKGSAWS